MPIPEPHRGGAPPQCRELVPSANELRHHTPEPQPPALLPSKAIGPVSTPSAAVERNKLEPPLQEGDRGGTYHRLAWPAGLQKLIEDRPLRAPRTRIDVDPARREPDEHLG